jgi:hypothetical protein
LESLPLDGLDQVQILEAVHLAQHNVSNLQIVGCDRENRAKLAGVDFARHGIPAWTKLNRFAFFQPVNVTGSPAHRASFDIVAAALTRLKHSLNRALLTLI